LYDLRFEGQPVMPFRNHLAWERYCEPQKPPETTGLVDDRPLGEKPDMAVSNCYGFLIEHGICSNDIWIADHDFGYQIGGAG
jgi:hypothetical protein